MRTLTIAWEKLVDALMHIYDVATTDSHYLVAYKPDTEGETVPARIIWADTPSAAGGYFANVIGEVNVDPSEFLDQSDGNYYGWGEEGAGSGPDGEWTEADTATAREWIESNLLAEVELDGERFAVKYE